MMKNYYSPKSFVFTVIAAFFGAMLLFTTNPVNAQVSVTESFDGAGPYPMSSLPMGWSQAKYCATIGAYPAGTCTDVDNFWERMGAGAPNPACSPLSGSGMMSYRSDVINAGEKAFLASKRFDMSGLIPPAGATGSFWMYRDVVTNLDAIQVLASTVPGIDPLAANTINIGPVPSVTRYCSGTPISACGQWVQINFTIPQVAPFSTSSSVYIVLLATSQAGNNIYIDDFQINTYPAAQQNFSSSAAVGQIVSTTAPNAVDQQIIGLRITTNAAGSVSPLAISDLVCNTNGSTFPSTDIANAKLYFTGGTPVFDPVIAQLVETYNNPWATNFIFFNSLIATPPFLGLENGDNYFWITYDIQNSASFGDYVDAEIVGYNSKAGAAAAQGRTPVPGTLAGARLIDAPYCVGTYTVGTQWAGYTNNDYVAGVVLNDLVTGGINNTLNNIAVPAGPVCPSAPGTCPFQSHPPDYELFTPGPNKTALLTAGTTYQIRLTVGTWYGSNYIRAWIDYDRSASFTNAVAPGPATELIAASGSLAANGFIQPTFTVPLTASPGNTRLRVREVYANSVFDACSHYYYGETEDYIITIIPPCAPAWPGWKTWLGFTDDWNNPANWCGGIPTLADDARIPQFGIGPNDRPGDFDPVIKSGVTATAKNLRIESNASTTIDAPTAGSLTVNETLLLLDNTSSLVVNSSKQDTAQVSNGMLTSPVPVSTANEPFKNNQTKTRNIWLFNAAELTAQGMLPGDVVTNIYMHLVRNSTNVAPLKNLTIKIYYTNPSPGLGFAFTGTGDLPPVVGPAPVTVFGPQDVSIAAAIGIGSSGTIDLSMIPGSFVWNGSANKLVVDMCYDNAGFATPNQVDKFTFTQPLIYPKHFLSVYNTKDNLNYPGCSMVPSYNLSSAAGVVTGAIGSNTINVTAPTVNKLAVGQWITGTGFTLTLTNVVSGAHPIGTTVINVTSTAGLQIGHYLNLGNGPMVTGYTATTITLGTPLNTALANSASLNFRPAIASIVGTTITLSTSCCGVLATPSGAIGFGTLNTQGGIGWDYRPNLTFKYDRPFQKYPINVKRDWNNNGTFTAGISKVTMNGTVQQVITGTNITTFYDFGVDNNAHVRMDRSAIVTDTLFLTNGRLKLNNQLLTLTNTSLGTITRSNGGLQSEQDVIGSDVSPFGRVRWTIGSTTTSRIIPFMNSSGVYIPLRYNVDAGTHDPTFATYSTPANNQNIPAPIVTTILGQVSPGVYGTNGNGMVDRYYFIDNTAGSGGPQADIVFSYAFGERAGYGNTNMRAQRWLGATTAWELPLIAGQTHYPGTALIPDSVLLPNFTAFTTSVWWTIVGQTTPLPVTMLDFKATPFKDRVRLDWVTGSEINSSHFIVERSVDNRDFTYIGRVESRGPTTNNTEYQTWDLNPVEGIQYYYLRQHDKDGRMESFGPVSAKFTTDMFEIVTATVSSSEMGLTVTFSYDSNEPYSYRIMDMTGRVIVTQDRNPATPGMNVIDIDAKLAKGAYQIVLMNSNKSVSRKFFY